MLIIGGSVINTVTVNGAIGDCNAQDYDGSGTIDAADKDTTAYKQCEGTKNNGYTVLNIVSVMMIIGGIIFTIKGYN